MADLSYTVDVNTTGAVNSLKKIDTQVKAVNDSFAKLKTAIAGIALTGLITRTIQFADAIQDVSDATGIAVDKILGFSRAVALNGGTADDANTALLRFNETLGKAGDGAVSAQAAFASIGISLEDLRTLSSEQLFVNTIDGLGKVGNLSEQARLKTELFGKSLRSTSLTGVSSQFAQATKESQAYASSVKAAADLQNKLDMAFKTLQASILKTIEPLANFVNKLDPKQIDDIVQAIVKMSVALGSIAVAAKGLQLIGSIALAVGGAFATLAAVTAVQTYRFTAFYYVVKQALPVFSSVGKAVVLLGTAAGTQIGTFVTLTSKLQGVLFIIKQLGVTIALFATKFLPRLIAPLALIYGAFEAARIIIKSAFDVDIVDEFVNAVSSAYGKVKGFFGMKPDGKPAEASYDETDRLKRRYPAPSMAGEGNNVTSGIAKQISDVQQITENFKEQNKQTNIKLALEASLIGLSEDQREVIQGIYELEEKRVAAISQLEDKLKNLSPDEKKLGLAKEITAQIEAVNKEYGIQQGLVVANIEQLQAAKAIEQARVTQLEYMTQQMQKQQEIAGVTSGVFTNLQKQISDAAFGKEQKGRSIFDQQKEQIIRNIKLLETDMANAVTEAFSTEDGIGDVQQYGIELKKVYALTEQLKQAQLEEIDLSRDWATGWSDAFASYLDNATNAYKIAGEQFSAITQGMNSAIDKFVDDGKFSFSDFATSVIKDLLKIELRTQAAMAMSAFKGAGGAGGILSTIGSFFGGFFAGGGQPPVGKASIVGENGPELFVPKSSGTIVPNGGSMGSTVNNYITNNNISAVDGASVARLFADNRRSLLGATQLAQKELPYGNR
jgi:lambda family phage tail tape measure protein